MSLGNSYPVRSTIPNTETIRGCWTGGGAAANCTVAAADWNRGIKSFNYNAATGKYLVTFVDSAQQIVGGAVEIYGAAGTAKKLAHIIRSSYSAANKTVQVEVWNGTGAMALTDLATTDVACCEFVFATNKPR